MQLILSVFIFIFSLIIGSFLNSVIYRLKFGGSIIFGRSRCPHCRHLLGFWDLIPVLSFIFLRGRCRYCHKEISVQYILVEIITAFLFLLVFNFQFFPRSGIPHSGTISNFQSIFDQILNFQNLTSIIYLLFVICCLIVIFVYDLKYSLILDNVILFAGGVSVIFYAVSVFLDKTFYNFWNLFLGLAVGGGIFLILYLVSRGRWIGAGDIKFGFLMGFWLLYPQIFVGLFFSFVLGGLVALILLLAGKKKMKSQIAFGPFLAVGTLIVLLFGQEILDWYLRWLGF
jgi:prepilin signal peptidase PulO-like enzyme (type II secretory pathway)